MSVNKYTFKRTLLHIHRQKSVFHKNYRIHEINVFIECMQKTR